MEGVVAFIVAIAGNIAGLLIARASWGNLCVLFVSTAFLAIGISWLMVKSTLRPAFLCLLGAVFSFSFYRSLPEWRSHGALTDSGVTSLQCQAYRLGYEVIKDDQNREWKKPCADKLWSPLAQGTESMNLEEKNQRIKASQNGVFDTPGLRLRQWIELKCASQTRLLQEWLRLFILGQQTFDPLMKKYLRGLRDLGLYHIMIISGLHISVLSLLFLSLCRTPLRILYGLRMMTYASFLNLEGMIRIFCCFCMLVYMNCVGCGVPVQRAGTFFVVSQFFHIFLSRPGLIWTASLTGILQIFIWPFSFIHVGTLVSWLSWIIVIIGLKKNRGTMSLVRMQFGFFLLGAAVFGLVSLSGWFFNLVIIPLMPLILVCSWLLVIRDMIPDFLGIWSESLLLSYLALLSGVGDWVGGWTIFNYNISSLLYTRGAFCVGLGMFLLSFFRTRR